MSISSVMVTGGASCVGVEICNQLVRRGVEVLLFDLPEQFLRVKGGIDSRVRPFFGSILDQAAVREALEDRNAVIHLAERSGVQRTEKDHLACLQTNIDGLRNILEGAVADRVQRVVFASSSEVYGEPPENPVGEGAPTLGNSVFAISKLAGEHWCQAFTQRYRSLSHVIVRYFNIYGSYQAPDFVIPRFVRSVRDGKPPVIFGEGHQIRSYAHASDVAAGTIEALMRPEADGEVFNLGDGRSPMDVSTLAELVIGVAEKDDILSPVYQPDFSFADRTEGRETFSRYCSTEKAKDVLGYTPRVHIEEGIRHLLHQGVLLDPSDTIHPQEDPGREALTERIVPEGTEATLRK